MRTPSVQAGALALLTATLGAAACAGTPRSATISPPQPLTRATQLVVVTTPDWDSTAGRLRRFVREGASSRWRPDGEAVPVVIGRTGLAWGVGFEGFAAPAAPIKREGDGRSPAGAFPLELAFGFPPADSARWLKLPYRPLTPATECVDDTASAHYNTVVERTAVPAVDWRSSERMRQIQQYRLGVIIGYNPAPPRRARGSCIFLHIWAGPRSTTAGCTALDEGQLGQLVGWLDPRSRPVVVQLPAAAYTRMQRDWGLPALDR